MTGIALLGKLRWNLLYIEKNSPQANEAPYLQGLQISILETPL